jgi:hypothetical protein
MATREAIKDTQIDSSTVDAACCGIYNDVFERTAIPEHAIHGLLGMQNKFGMRIINDYVTHPHAVSCRADRW